MRAIEREGEHRAGYVWVRQRGPEREVSGGEYEPAVKWKVRAPGFDAALS